MEDDQFQTMDFLLAILMAPIVALSLGVIAHFVFGLSRFEVRLSALMGATILAVIVALVSAIQFYGKLRKSK
jgi:cation transporter-like permease